MKRFTSKFSSLVRVISIVVIVAMIVSMLMLVLAHDENEYTPEHIETVAHEAEVIVTPVPPPPEAETPEAALLDGDQTTEGTGNVYEAQQPEPEPIPEPEPEPQPELPSEEQTTPTQETPGITPNWQSGVYVGRLEFGFVVYCKLDFNYFRNCVCSYKSCSCNC